MVEKFVGVAPFGLSLRMSQEPVFDRVGVAYFHDGKNSIDTNLILKNV